MKEGMDRAGGLFDLRHSTLQASKRIACRICSLDLLKQAGVHFHLNTEVVGDNPRPGQGQPSNRLYEQIRMSSPSRQDFINPATLEIAGADLPQVQPALEFLTASTRHFIFGESVPAFNSGALNAHGKNVAVLGAGDTARDCQRTSVLPFRQGAASVVCYYRRGEDDMPGSMTEYKAAVEEGVKYQSP